MRQLLWLLVWASSGALATINAYDFDNPEQEQQFRQLITELRCPKCQNQNISDSNAGLAKDIKDRAYRLIQEGRSNDQITQYMVDRYGDFITYRPPLKPSTWFLWFGPFVVTMLAVLVLLALKLRNRPRPPAPVPAEQQHKVEQLLRELDESDHKH
ncbi:MAG: cytochrome c-type biogenesis protein CcmH [Pseudomonadales bacterium]|nr:cytochrome c-type biogenesis protein CcmH [Pseudomonadales bacterium]